MCTYGRYKTGNVTGSYNSSYVHVYELNTLTINLKRLHREVAAEVELPLDL